MDHESQAAIREAALDYFTRSDSIGRCRAWVEPPPGVAAGAASPGWTALAELGWPGMLAPESVGGLALGLTGAAEILCAAGTHVAPEPLLAVAGLSAVLLARLVSRHGSDVVGCAQPSERSARRIAQPIPSVLASDATPRCASMASADRQMIGDATLERPGARALLAELVAGRSLPALAWQESPGDLSAVPLNCGCEPRTGPEGGVLLQGEKLMVLPGAAASGWLVSARGDGDGDTVLLWVPRGTPGVSETLTTLVDGTQAAALRLEQVALPASALLAQGNAAQDALRQALACARILQSAELLGVGQAMLEQTLAHLRSRSQFGVPIGSFQALQHRCVDMYIHLEVARATLTEVLALADAMLAETTLALERLEAQASRVNARCSAAALLISRSALQLHGAIGYTQECALSLFYKRTLRLSAWLGNASAHQRHYAALAAAAPTGTGPAPDDAAWEQGFPRTADWAAMPEAPFRRMLRAFLRQHYPAPLRYLSHRARWSEMRAWYLRLSAQGWIAPAWPQAHGGMGLPADKLIAWIEELEQYGVARAPDQGIVMIGPLLIQHGTPGQQQRFLPKILSGEHVWCQGYSEPNAGSDLAGLRTEAVRAQDAQGEHFIVNGQKIWTTLAQDANHIFMLVRTDKNAKKQAGISFLLCDLRTPGITIRPIQTLAGEPEFCELFFDDVRVPAENLVGQLHAGWSIAKALLGFERIFLGSPKQSQYALGQLERLAQARRLFADPVFVQRYTALRLDVADLSAAYAGFANIVKAGKPLPASVSLLKIWASETYHRIGALLVEASEEQGAIAGDQELDGQTFNALAPLIGASSAMIYGGTNEIQRNILARQVLHLPG
ncbi:acyl-CoA dehydrogenase [Verminephrobacter eiseniae]|uniref:acyl-CoA dehydrogenase n=1 Tax=Verminephrobacter eiseniae TaxID=364317 RepID=UPI00223804F1|nr:acyl-CoA dehydrogenase family protein [Verminephrobacter eiseniae]MCW5263575.1 acyl-CoA dehydrogenase [Verminephrobacter eiseniae]